MELGESVASITSIVCGQLAIGEDWSKIFQSNQCTTYGYKIAKNLIRVAATRIFSKAEQSIMEPIVNSVDAYSTNRRVGKFGMGFFSLLYWIFEVPGTTMTIRSNHITGSYIAVIYEAEGELMMKYTPVNKTSQTGLDVEIQFGQAIDKSIREEFKNQFDRLRFIDSANIELVDYAQSNAPKQNIYNEIRVVITNRIIRVKDYATGVDMKTLLTSLVVPAVSTKTIALSERRSRHVDNSRLINTRGLYMTVADVVIVKINAGRYNRFGGVMDLPDYTRLPVARDDIILRTIAKEFEESFVKLFILATKTGKLLDMEKQFERYTEETDSRENAMFVADIMKKIPIYAQQAGILLFPSKTEVIVDRLKGMDIAVSKYGSPLIAERALDLSDIKSRDDIYIGKKVVEINGLESPTSAGLYKYLFVPVGVTDWNRLAFNYKGDHLTMTYSKLSDSILNENISRMNVPEETISLYRSLSAALLLQKTEAGRVVKKSEGSWLGEHEKSMTHVVWDRIANMRNYFKRFPRRIENRILMAEIAYFAVTELDSVTYGGDPSILLPEAPIREYTPVNLQTFSEEGRKTIIKLMDYIGDYTDMYMSKFPSNKQYHLDTMIYYPIVRTGTVDIVGSMANTILDPAGATKINIAFLRALEKSINAEHYFLAADTIKNLGILLPRDSTNLTMVVDYILELTMVERAKFITDSMFAMSLPASNSLAIETKVLSYNQTLDRESILPEIKRASIDFETNSFMLSDFMSLVFQKKDIPRIDMIEEAINRPGYIRKDLSSLQTIEIAINEGTSRDSSTSKIIETVQNSIDAVSITGNNASIEIEIYSVLGENAFAIAIKDPVGIAADNLIAMSIPFLSSKSDVQIATGEMGTGFFNVYRDSASVFIKTSPSASENVVLLMDEPVMEGDRVIDIERRVNFSPNTDGFKGTHVSMFSPVYSMRDYTSKVVDAYFTANQVAVMSSIHNNMKFQGTTYPKLKPIREDEDFEIFSIGFDIKSYILTKGVPFAPLEDFMVSMGILSKGSSTGELLSSGMAINIKTDIYSPVQSRSKLIMAEGDKAKLIVFILTSIPFYILSAWKWHNFIYRSSEFIIDNMNSYFSPRQMIPDTRTFLVTLSELKGNISPLFKESIGEVYDIFRRMEIHVFGESMNQIIAKVIKSTRGNDYIETVNQLYGSQEGIAYDNLRSILLKWFKKKEENEKREEAMAAAKRREKKEAEPSSGQTRTKRKDKVVSLNSDVTEFMTIWLDEYIRGMNALKISKSVKTPKLRFVETSAAGYYRRIDHSISLNHEYFTEPDYKQDLMEYIKLFTLNYEDMMAGIREMALSGNKFYDAMVAPTQTIPHEVEHSRTGDAHKESSHDRTNIIIDGVSKKRTYRQTHIDTMNAIVKNGFYERVMGRLRMSMFKPTIELSRHYFRDLTKERMSGRISIDLNTLWVQFYILRTLELMGYTIDIPSSGHCLLFDYYKNPDYGVKSHTEYTLGNKTYRIITPNIIPVLNTIPRKANGESILATHLKGLELVAEHGSIMTFLTGATNLNVLEHPVFQNIM